MHAATCMARVSSQCFELPLPFALYSAMPALWPRPWYLPPTQIWCCAVQTSLAQFVELYELSIDHSERAVLPAKRIANIIEHLT